MASNGYGEALGLDKLRETVTGFLEVGDIVASTDVFPDGHAETTGGIFTGYFDYQDYKGELANPRNADGQYPYGLVVDRQGKKEQVHLPDRAMVTRSIGALTLTSVAQQADPRINNVTVFMKTPHAV